MFDPERASIRYPFIRFLSVGHLTPIAHPCYHPLIVSQFNRNAATNAPRAHTVTDTTAAQAQAQSQALTQPPHRTRTRGAQLGNTNALKHGFYARAFRDLEAADLDMLLRDGLTDEITMLRVMMRRTMDLADKIKDVDTIGATLGVLGMTATRLAGLLRTQKILGGDNSSTAAAIAQALSEVATELGL